jgi:hypothetical protein
MGKIAGLRLRDRWADWDRTPFTADSGKQVAVFEKQPQEPVTVHNRTLPYSSDATLES